MTDDHNQSPSVRSSSSTRASPSPNELAVKGNRITRMLQGWPSTMIDQPMLAEYLDATMDFSPVVLNLACQELRGEAKPPSAGKLAATCGKIRREREEREMRGKALVAPGVKAIPSFSERVDRLLGQTEGPLLLAKITVARWADLVQRHVDYTDEALVTLLRAMASNPSLQIRSLGQNVVANDGGTEHGGS